MSPGPFAPLVDRKRALLGNHQKQADRHHPKRPQGGKVFLEGDPGVATVTKTGLIVCDKTYFFANVSSVGLAWRRKHKISGWFLITLGTMWILFGFLTAQGFNFVAGLALLGWGMWLRDKVDYIVRLRTPGGESDVLTTRNREFAQRIVNAVEQAIASRG